MYVSLRGLCWFLVIKPARQTGLTASVGVVVVVVLGLVLCMKRGRRFGLSFVLLCICFIRALLYCTTAEPFFRLLQYTL